MTLKEIRQQLVKISDYAFEDNLDSEAYEKLAEAIDAIDEVLISETFTAIRRNEKD